MPSGSLFFDLFEALSRPLACQGGARPPRGGADPLCTTAAVGPDEVVNQVTLEVDSRFSGYASCGECAHGRGPLGGACKDGTRSCQCIDGGGLLGPSKLVPCNDTVGLQNVYTSFRRLPGLSGGVCRPSLMQPSPTAAHCYASNSYAKLSEASLSMARVARDAADDASACVR